MTLIAQKAIPTPARARSLRADTKKATIRTAGSAAPQRTIDPNSTLLSTAPNARTPAAGTGARRHQATGSVIASTPIDAPSAPCGWPVGMAPLVKATA